MAKENHFGTGCLSFFLTLVIAVVITAFGKYYVQTNAIIIFVLALVIANFMVSLLFEGSSKARSFKFGKYSGLVVLLFIAFGVFKLFQSSGDSSEDVALNTSENTIETSYLKTSEADSIKVFSHNRNWSDFYGATYSSDFMVRERDYLSLKDETKSFSYQGRQNFWGDLYLFLANSNSPSLDLVYEAFTEIGNSENLNKRQFADMVVTMVQDMPYALVFEGACLSPNNYEEPIAQILRQCPSCCIGNKRYGLQNPVSYLANLKGDCDTRTVLLYTVLDHFGYKVAILNSDFYKHSILGITLPTRGTYKVFKGKKYYVWETTAKNFVSGTLPATFKDINQWHVVLTNN